MKNKALYLSLGAKAFSAIGNSAIGNAPERLTSNEAVPVPFTYLPYWPDERPMPKRRQNQSNKKQD